jgi:hypothetical protein
MLRYTKTRSGTFEPKLQRFVVRDFVYLKRQKADSPDTRVGRLVLRVKSVDSGGRLVLEGRDRKLIRDHVENCAPCHLPNLDIWRNPKLARGDVDHGCQVCHLTTGGLTMLLCDGYGKGWHRACLDPPLLATPVEDWFCPRFSQHVLPFLRRSPCPYCRIEPDLLANTCQTV